MQIFSPTKKKILDPAILVLGPLDLICRVKLSLKGTVGGRTLINCGTMIIAGVHPLGDFSMTSDPLEMILNPVSPDTMNDPPIFTSDLLNFTDPPNLTEKSGRPPSLMRESISTDLTNSRNPPSFPDLPPTLRDHVTSSMGMISGGHPHQFSIRTTLSTISGV